MKKFLAVILIGLCMTVGVFAKSYVVNTVKNTDTFKVKVETPDGDTYELEEGMEIDDDFIISVPKGCSITFFNGENKVVIRGTVIAKVKDCI